MRVDRALATDRDLATRAAVTGGPADCHANGAGGAAASGRRNRARPSTGPAAAANGLGEDPGGPVAGRKNVSVAADKNRTGVAAETAGSANAHASRTCAAAAAGDRRRHGETAGPAAAADALGEDACRVHAAGMDAAGGPHGDVASRAAVARSPADRDADRAPVAAAGPCRDGAAPAAVAAAAADALGEYPGRPRTAGVDRHAARVVH